VLRLSTFNLRTRAHESLTGVTTAPVATQGAREYNDGFH
jgi:hypothetical protein